MTETNTEIIRQEDYTESDYSEKKIIFDSNIFEKVKGKEMDLSVEKVFEIPKIKNLFKRSKEEYYLLSQKEHIIDCKYTQGKAEVPSVICILNSPKSLKLYFNGFWVIMLSSLTNSIFSIYRNIYCM